MLNLVHLTHATTAFEIGTAFGYSALMLTAGVRSHTRSGWVCSLDAQLEGAIGEMGLSFARRWATEMGLDSTLVLMKGLSPTDVSTCVGTKTLDLVFIDGDHRENQPLIDYLAVRPFLSTDSVIVWHDVHESYDVPAAIEYSRIDGYETAIFNTSCRIAVSYRNPSVLRHIENAMQLALSGKLAWSAAKRFDRAAAI